MAFMNRIRILGTGRYLPEKIVNNNYFVGRQLYKYNSNGTRELAEPKNEEDIYGVTGIRERRYAVNESLAEMGYKAAKMALDRARIEARSLDGIIAATLGADENIPPIACQIQKYLGVSAKYTFDVNAACAGFPIALELASALSVGNAEKQRYLVMGAEKLSVYIDPDDINSNLFGDGAGAVVIETFKSDEQLCKPELLSFYSETDSSNGKSDFIYSDKSGFLRMPNGKAVFKEAVLSMTQGVNTIRKELDWENQEVIVIPHQANGRIIQALQEQLGGSACVYNNIEKYGNISAATCAVALDEALENGFIKQGDKVILTTVGAGMVSSGAAIQF